MNKLWFDKSLSKAVDEPRVHTQLVGKRDEKLVPDDNVYTEKKYRLDSSIVKGLEKTRAQDESGAYQYFIKGRHRKFRRYTYDNYA